MSLIDAGTTASACTVYLDSAAELSKIDRKNHKQVSDSGKSLMYDLLITVATPQGANTGNNGILDVQTFTAAPNWQTRNAVRMAHYLREELREEAGVVKGSIGRYAKNLRLNLDGVMQNLVYLPPSSVSTSSNQRMYAMSNLGTTSLGTNAKWFAGGIWDLSLIHI